jgi:hypothetical protein
MSAVSLTSEALCHSSNHARVNTLMTPCPNQPVLGAFGSVTDRSPLHQRLPGSFFTRSTSGRLVLISTRHQVLFGPLHVEHPWTRKDRSQRAQARLGWHASGHLIERCLVFLGYRGSGRYCSGARKGFSISVAPYKGLKCSQSRGSRRYRSYERQPTSDKRARSEKQEESDSPSDPSTGLSSTIVGPRRTARPSERVCCVGTE